jgi:hypothetical protein
MTVPLQSLVVWYALRLLWNRLNTASHDAKSHRPAMDRMAHPTVDSSDSSFICNGPEEAFDERSTSVRAHRLHRLSSKTPWRCSIYTDEVRQEPDHGCPDQSQLSPVPEEAALGEAAEDPASPSLREDTELNGVGAIASGEKGKARDILAAIRVLTQVEAEHRHATREERHILAGFAGPAALPDRERGPW